MHTAPAPAERTLPTTYRALCVGINGDYAHLENCRFAVTDAVHLHHSLSVHCGYRSRLLKPRRAAEFWAALDALAQQAQPGDTVLVYIACHGVEVPLRGEPAEVTQWQQLLLFPDCSPAEVVAQRERAAECLPLPVLLAHVVRTARQANWVFFVDACRGIPEELRDLQPPRRVEEEIFARDIGLRRKPGTQVVRDENWTLVQACGAGEQAHELPRLQRGLLAHALQRAMEDTAQAGQPLWADTRLCWLLQRLMDADRLSVAPQASQGIEYQLSEPPTPLLPARERPRPLPPPAARALPRWTWMAVFLGMMVLGVGLARLWFDPPTPPPCQAPLRCMAEPPPPPPPPPCSCASCPACPPPEMSLCDPARPGAACGRARLHIWDGHAQAFWVLGSSERIERPAGPGQAARPLDWSQLWGDPVLQTQWRSGQVSHVIVLGTASQELPIGMTAEQGLHAEEDRACQRATTLLRHMAPSLKDRGWAMVLGRHQAQAGDAGAEPTHKQRPVAIVTVLDKPAGLDNTQIARQVSDALARDWSRHLGHYSLAARRAGEPVTMQRQPVCAPNAKAR